VERPFSAESYASSGTGSTNSIHKNISLRECWVGPNPQPIRRAMQLLAPPHCTQALQQQAAVASSRPISMRSLSETAHDPSLSSAATHKDDSQSEPDSYEHWYGSDSQPNDEKMNELAPVTDKWSATPSDSGFEDDAQAHVTALPLLRKSSRPVVWILERQQGPG
jgi:hypothetical protein